MLEEHWSNFKKPTKFYLNLYESFLPIMENLNNIVKNLWKIFMDYLKLCLAKQAENANNESLRFKGMVYLHFQNDKCYSFRALKLWGYV